MTQRQRPMRLGQHGDALAPDYTPQEGPRVTRNFDRVASGARRTQKKVWDEYGVNNGRFLLGIASIVAVGIALGVMFIWLVGLIPGFPTSPSRYGGVYYILSLFFTVVGIAVSFSQIVEFYGLSLVLVLVALLLNGWALGGILYNFVQCDRGVLPPSCVDYYYVDSLMFWFTLGLFVACFVSVLGHAMVILHVGPSQSVAVRYRRPPRDS